MPGPMPFHLEKGPWILELEQLLNGELDEVWRVLRACRTPDGFRTMVHEYAGSTGLDDDPMYRNAKEREQHLLGHWFGESTAAGGPQPPFGAWLREVLGVEQAEDGPVTPDAVQDWLHDLSTEQLRTIGRWPTTGFWRQYCGDVAEIVRLTLVSALEVSLGLHRGSDQRDDVGRQLPIELFWKCPQPWFEGWVTWRLHNDTIDVGQVTVVLATPGTGTPVLQSPLFGRRPVESPVTVERGATPTDPTSYHARPRVDGYADRGMWVVTHQENVLLPSAPSIIPTGSGQWDRIIPPIGPSYAGVGPVVVVEPSLRDGGVREPSSERVGKVDQQVGQGQT
jgi:hypothetical protein